MWAKKVSEIEGRISPMVFDTPVLRLRASRFGSYARERAQASTRLCVSALIPFLSPCPERTHETVVFERLSLQAMSLSDAPTIYPYKQCSTKIKFFRHSANNPAVK
jgi:hypothetical protein